MATADGLVLESVGIRSTLLDPLVGLGAEIFGSFELHGFVEEDFDGVGHPFKAVVGQ
jgi:hypothetical protein